MTNMIFSRRAIQQKIDSLNGKLCEDAIESLIYRLNTPNNDRLPSMWEAVVLSALSNEEDFQHEVPLEGGKKPDFEFSVSDLSHKAFVVGDITTVSDRGLDEKNPVRAFGDEAIRVARKYGLNPSHFHIQVAGESKGRFGDARVELTLPPKRLLHEFVKMHVEPWIQRLSREKHSRDVLKHVSDDAAFTATYDTRQRGFSMGHLSYDVAASRRKNPLFAALKRKVSQLKSASPNAVRIIIVCDGDCQLLSQRGRGLDDTNFSAADVAADFLRQNGSIDYVLLLTVLQQGQHWDRNFRLSATLVVQEGRDETRGGPRVQVNELIRALVERILRQLPKPTLMPANARSRCLIPGPGPDHIGGYELSNTIKISSRALHRLLAGEISSEEFLAAHGWRGERRNPFEIKLAEGRTFATTSIERKEDADDDWIEFAFGGFDAAAGPFRLPRM